MRAPIRALGLALAATAGLPLLPGSGPGPGAAAAQGTGWNGPRALELVARARERRQEPLADSLLRTYRADATGHIYFFLDREEAGEPVLLRADQVALELYWSQPGRAKQVIQGMRSEEQFPIKDFAYYLDRYTVIQNGFGDEIRVGEGRDVADVPHPLAPGAGTLYDYRLADSMTIRLPGEAEPLRVYEIQVRPRDFDLPAIVGSLYLERARGDLVRLAFTFTPAAYLDPRNERVEVALENALWEGRYWLPREQRLLVRREIPELDLDVGTVIRAVVRVSDYEMNPDLPRGFFSGRGVIAAVGPQALAAYDFDEGLYDALDDVGLAPGAEPGTLDDVDVDEIAGRILRQRFLRGIPRLRLYAPNASSILRYDRAEGLVTGAGFAWGLGERQVTAYGAWAWGAERPIVELGLRPLPGAEPGWIQELYWGRPVDLGLRPGAAGVMSSIAATFGDDYRDLHFVDGAALARQLDSDDFGTLTLAAAFERHRSASPAVAEPPFRDAGAFRPIFPIDEGSQASLALRGRAAGSAAWGGRSEARFALEGGRFDPDAGDARWFGIASLDVLRAWRGADMDWGLDLRQTLRLALEPALQHGVLLGGRNTLPGYDYRSLYAEQVALMDVEAWVTVIPRWARLRALAAGAWLRSGGDDGRSLFPASLGAGLGFIDGILRLDVAFPVGQLPGADDFVFDGGGDVVFGGAGDRGPVLILSLDPRLWPFL